MKKILIVDNHEVVRAGVIGIIGQDGTTFGEAADGLRALEMVREQDWDLAILDIALEDRYGLELVKELKRIRPALPVLVLSVHEGVQYAKRAFRAGAAGYVTKDIPRAELTLALHAVMEGGRYVSSAIAEKLAVDLHRSTDRPPHDILSCRELEVLWLIGSGKTVGEIASQFQLSDKTISTYRARILEKMGMKSSAEITRYAVQHNLTSLPAGPVETEGGVPVAAKSRHPPRSIRNVGQPMNAASPSEAVQIAPVHQAVQVQEKGISEGPGVLSRLIPYVGLSGANQILESVTGDMKELSGKVESVLSVFLGRRAGMRLASRIFDDAAAGVGE